MNDEIPPKLAGIVIPAHNEARSIGRLLAALVPDSDASPLDVVVVCNGCTDDTAAVARAHGVRVIEDPVASKRHALRVGDEAAATLPRLYVDADVEIGLESVRRLVGALGGSVLASGPSRVMPRDGVGLLVRWYYDVWERLPQVRDSLFGRGVIALTAAGNDRIRALPPVMADDLAISEAFAADERVVVPHATVVVRPPKRIGDLVRRRTRAVTGNAQARAAGLSAHTAPTSPSVLLGVVREQPRLAVRMPVFLGVTFAARFAARRRIKHGDFDTWLRDESSRDG